MKFSSLGPIELTAGLGSFAIGAATSVGFHFDGSADRDGSAVFWGVLVSLAISFAASGVVVIVMQRYLKVIEGLSSIIDVRRLQTAPPVTPDPFGDVVHAIVELRTRLTASVEARREIRKQAEESDRYETEFLRSLSHELRTPLNAIVGFTQVVLEEIDGPINESQKEDLETILASGVHLTELVDDVLDLAAMQSARFQLDRAPVDVSPLLKSVALLLEGQRRGKEVLIQCDLPEQPMVVFGDTKRLRQVFMNLASNALKFTESGFVKLGVSCEGREICASVSDSGPGINSEELALIFEEFAQVGDVRRKGQGTGLGLAICQRLVALHEGRISVESVVGQGSTFRVHLPVGRPGEPGA